MADSGLLYTKTEAKSFCCEKDKGKGHFCKVAKNSFVKSVKGWRKNSVIGSIDAEESCQHSFELIKAKSFKIVSRGILLMGIQGVNREFILLCQNVEHGYFFLPGGIVEHGESAKVTVVRELKEEFGLAVRTYEFAGMFEQVFEREGDVVHECDFVFFLECKEKEQIVMRNEPYIKPMLVPLEHLELIDLRPKAICKSILSWLKGKGNKFVSAIK